MASHEQQPIPDPATDDLDLGFKAGIGFYLGIVVAGLTTVVGIVADASTATLLATAPSTVTAVLLLSLVFGDRLRGLPEQIGRSRRRRLLCYVPVVAFISVLLLPAFTAHEYTARLTTVTIALILLTGAIAVGVARMTRNRYVDAVTADEPAATWPYHRTGFGVGGYAFTASMVVMVVGGLYSAWAWNLVQGLFVAGYGTVFLLTSHFDWGSTWNSVDPSDQWNPPKLRVHDAGLVLERAYVTNLVSWDAITDVRLTDDELVLERRWLDIHCDRSVIDDPEAVYAEIERVRGQSDRSPTLENRSANTELSD